MINNAKIRPSINVLQAPFIKIDATIIQPGTTNGKPNIRAGSEYVIAPSGKKIATFIVNQIFGSELMTQTEGLQISWLMPSLKEALEECVYQEEAFVYIHRFDEKIYLECFRISDIHDLVQKYDKFVSGRIVQEIPKDEDTKLILERTIKIDKGISYLTFQAFEENKQGKKEKISLEMFNRITNSDYLENYILPYEVIVNVDIGQDFFKDSRKLLNAEMEVVNIIADELEKTRTRIATTQHYQSGDIVMNWKPSSTQYKVENLSVGKLQDYFTLLPGDKEHQMFEFLQGNIRVKEYIETFKFYDYQCIQMAGLSPASFGYEKDSYMNTDNVDLSKNASDMTVEAIKSQIEPQINKLIENIIKAQKTQNVKINLLPSVLNWDYGINEKFDDMKKLQVLSKIQSVASIPYETKAKIITPILLKLIDEVMVKDNEKFINSMIDNFNKEQENINIQFGEV